MTLKSGGNIFTIFFHDVKIHSENVDVIQVRFFTQSIDVFKGTYCFKNK